MLLNLILFLLKLKNKCLEYYKTLAKIFSQFNAKYNDIGSYECQASTPHHTSTANCSLDIRKFDVIVYPGRLELEIGTTAIFTCSILPELPSWLENGFTYKWSRGDNVPLSSKVTGINTDTITIVSNYDQWKILPAFFKFNPNIIIL